MRNCVVPTSYGAQLEMLCECVTSVTNVASTNTWVIATLFIPDVTAIYEQQRHSTKTVPTTETSIARRQDSYLLLHTTTPFTIPFSPNISNILVDLWH